MTLALAFKLSYPFDYTLFSFQGLDNNLPMDQRRYINPGDYRELMELLQTFTTEVDRSKTKLNAMIGQGTVLYQTCSASFKGTLRIPLSGSKVFSE